MSAIFTIFFSLLGLGLLAATWHSAFRERNYARATFDLVLALAMFWLATFPYWIWRRT
jgi:hypothetical protein